MWKFGHAAGRSRRGGAVFAVFVVGVAGLSGSVALSSAVVAATPEFATPVQALRQGVSAYRGGYYEIAIPALEHAAQKDMFLGQYYLAQIYADNNSAHTDHAKAYVLFLQIANAYADVDPEDDGRARFVARALVRLAKYLQQGLPEIGVKRNPERAADYLHHAAIFFNDEDAQFELSKLQLTGEGVRANVAGGKHWLSILSKKGHAGAQAFLANLYWRGRYVEADPIRALALISVAVKNAPSQDRLWIEDIFQDIFCGASTGVRKQVTGMVAEWDDRYGRKPASNPDRYDVGLLDARPVRTCRDGEVVPVDTGLAGPDGQMVGKKRGDAMRLAKPKPGLKGSQPPNSKRPQFMTGSAAGGRGADSGIRGVGAVDISPAAEGR